MGYHHCCSKSVAHKTRLQEHQPTITQSQFARAHRSTIVKGYSMPAIGHRNVTVPLRVLAGVE